MNDTPKLSGRVILVHGFNVRDGGLNTVVALRPYFEAAGFEVKLFRYGWTGLLGTYFLNARFAQILADLSEPGDIAVGHSNGCALIHESVHLGATFSQLVYVNPALDRDAALPAGVQRAHVWHSPSDLPVRFARWLPSHPWGNMGSRGYVGADRRFTNYNKETGFPPYSSREHSDVFKPGLIEFFGPQIVAAVVHQPTQ